MGRKRPDPRVSRQALPPLATVKGEPANRTLRLKCQEEKCSKCKCAGDVLTSRTVQTSTGVAIQRLCYQCLTGRERGYIPAGSTVKKSYLPDYATPVVQQRVDTYDPTLKPRKYWSAV